MHEKKAIAGFSKWPKSKKIKWLVDNFSQTPEDTGREMERFWHPDAVLQRIIDGFSENTVSNYLLPYGIAPNFLIDGRYYAIPMVIEESSVVAAASSAAKFWADRGGFHTRIVDTRKMGQVHFFWKGDFVLLKSLEPELKAVLNSRVEALTANMRKRGGGVTGMEFLNFSQLEPDYYQLLVSFETCDSMGANFINSVLEAFAEGLQHFISQHPAFAANSPKVDVLMSILSNYTPDCLVEVWAECPAEDLDILCGAMSGPEFADRFAKAVRVACIDPFRAVTHNKGIFNGIDAVVLATGNDFRAIEACGHAYAARDGQYRSLSRCEHVDGLFRFHLELPLAVGTVGGLTKLHPLAKQSLEILGNPSARELMSIIASVGLAQNFSAVRSLITTGIQQGHMKLHLQNILHHLGANEVEVEAARVYFEDKTVSHSAVGHFLAAWREAEQIAQGLVMAVKK
ncbi:MAG: hydroxymethylglutaryl-CoA reductase, degradative [Saprospirales bacterium]|nr:hydroxymethylglutaryl-CoA reductase, degradative [Saprospirales bacterium]